MRFIESPVFTASLRRHLDDEQYRALQSALTLRPDQGPLIPGGAGLRKLRWGARYAKNEQGDLSPTQLRALARVVREEFK
ncbi:MAG: hypothetical protein ACREN6_00635 [Gemmatimonadaceae bacterium]